MKKQINTIEMSSTGRFGSKVVKTKMNVKGIPINHIGYHRYNHKQFTILNFELQNHNLEFIPKKYDSKCTIDTFVNSLHNRYYDAGICKEFGTLKYGVSAMLDYDAEYDYNSDCYTVSRDIIPISCNTRPVEVIGCDTGDANLFVFSDGSSFGNFAKIIAVSGNTKLTGENFNEVLEVTKQVVEDAISHVGERIVVVESEIGVTELIQHDGVKLHAKLINNAWDMFAKGILELSDSKDSLSNVQCDGMVTYTKLPMLLPVAREHTTNTCSKCLTPNRLRTSTKIKPNGELKYRFKKVTCGNCDESHDTDVNASIVLQQYGTKILDAIYNKLKDSNV